MSQVSIGDVKAFWDANPCQSDLSNREDRREYFQEISRKRYQGREWHIPLIANFDGFAEKDVLEIGVGMGSDAFEFARAGARYCGIDLTPASIAQAQERFELFNLPGTFKVANAEERIPFDDERFDHVYSWGVIHHSPRTEAMVAEMHRVLRPGGTFTVMLYNRSSINYYIEIMFLRRVLRFLLYPAFMPGLVSRLTGFAEWKLVGHHKRLRQGRVSKEEWVSMNTDGPDCPLAKVYNKREAAALFGQFRDVRQDVWEFNTDHWPFLRRLIPETLARKIGRLWGWSRVVHGTK
jgi:ubiquinone/menaquinone biosynthesis C-methylase UbiE